MPPAVHTHRFKVSTFVVTYVVLFVLLAIFGYYASGKASVTFQHVLNAPRHRFATDMATYDIPPMTVSMGDGEGGGGIFGPRIRLDVSLEIAAKDRDIISGYEPRMTEKINAYVIKLKSDQLMSHAAMPWLRRELLQQVNSVGSPAPVHDLYFQEFLVM